MSEVIAIKTADEIALMRQAGLVVYEILNELENMSYPGCTTWDLEMKARDLIKKHKVEPAFLNYRGFPCVLCTSLDHEVVHGIPSKKRVLEPRSILKLDFGVSFRGWFADSARTVIVSRTDRPIPVVAVTKDALYAGIEACRVGNRLGDISSAIRMELYRSSSGIQWFSPVEGFTGHGIGQALHEFPPIPNDRIVKGGTQLRAGMTFALEPMVITGRNGDAKILEDGWTAVATSGEVSAHFEHTVLVTDKGPDILTLPEVIL